MRKRTSPDRLFMIAAAVFLVAACDDAPDPKDEAPIKLRPGLYQISVGGAVLRRKAQSEPAASICVGASETEMFPYELAEKRFTVHGACRPQRFPREGNFISGEVVCAADPKMATGTTRYAYEGVVAEDGVSLEARMKLDVEMKDKAGGEGVSERQLRLAMKAVEQIRSTIEAERVGECGR